MIFVDEFSLSNIPCLFIPSKYHVPQSFNNIFYFNSEQNNIEFKHIAIYQWVENDVCNINNFYSLSIWYKGNGTNQKFHMQSVQSMSESTLQVCSTNLEILKCANLTSIKSWTKSDELAMSSGWSNFAFPDACCMESSYVAEDIKTDQKMIQRCNQN